MEKPAAEGPKEGTLDIYTEHGFDLEEVIWTHAKQVHHIAHHSEDEQEDAEPVDIKELVEKCAKCSSLATAHSLDTSLLKIKHAKPKFGLEPWKPKNPTNLQLFEAEFENDMENKQKFSFKAERKTTSIASVELKNPVLFGSEGYKLSVRLPEEIKTVCPAFGEELHPTKGKEEFKEEIRWSVDNLIECPPRKTTKAYLMLKEHRYASGFMIDTAMKGTVTVTIHEENRERPQQVTVDIAEVVQNYIGETSANTLDKEKKPEVEFKVDGQGKVYYTTEGRCKFVFGVEQYIRVETVEKPGSDVSSSCCVIM